MLALGLEQARRRGSGVTGLQKQATVAWQPPSSGKPPSHEQGSNIRQKISQWEVRSHQGDGQQEAGVKAHRLVVSKAASVDVAEDDWSSDSSLRSRAKSLGLDFRETQARGGRSEVAPSSSSDTWTPLSERKPRKKAGKWEPCTNFDLPKHSAASSDDSEDNLPPGNFYTSRGFWRRLEGDKLHWEKGREASGEPLPLPPPKPQRTFQYRAAGSPDGPSARRHGDSPDKCSDSKGRGMARPPGVAPPPCPAAKANGLSRHKKNRKSFEYEDATRLTTTTQRDAAAGGEARLSGLHHAFSDDNIYEDIVCEMRSENSYENVKLSPMCLPIARPRPWTISQRRSANVPKLPPKPQTLRGYAGKAERRDSPTPRRTSTLQTQQQPHFVNMIEVIFDAKRGRKRVKIQGATAQEETSGTESDPEDSTKAGCRRSVYVQTTLKRRPGYRTLERDLIQLQQQQLFQLFVVVSLRKDFPGNTYSPEITQQFPKIFEKASRNSREAEDRLKAIPRFCFPDPQDWRPSADVPSETFSFVLTGEDGSRWFCYCRKILPSGKGKRLPEVHCIVSKLGCFDLFAKILDEVERRREICPALVHPFMRSVMEAPFPAPGRTITVKSFLPGSGNEVLTLCRPVDSRLEHVDFDSLLQCLSVGRLLQVFASLLLERRVIFIADTLSVLSRCSHAALALLYPFTWQHTFVPVLPSSLLDICCSPTPFLLGALSPCVPQLLELPIEEVLIVDLCADKFVIQLGDEDCILPSKLQAALQQILEEREDMLRQEDGCSSEGQQEVLSSLLSEAFVRFFVELVGHYPLHMSESSSGVRELQRDSFRKSHPSRGARQFLQLFMDTQMFAGFIHDKELRKGGDKGLFEIRAAEYLESEPEPEPSSVNKFLKGLGNKIKFLQIK